MPILPIHGSCLWCWRRGPPNVKLAAAARPPPSSSGHEAPRQLCLKVGAGVLAGRPVQARLDRDRDLIGPVERLRWQRPLLEAGVALDDEVRLRVLWLEHLQTWKGAGGGLSAVGSVGVWGLGMSYVGGAGLDLIADRTQCWPAYLPSVSPSGLR